MNNVHKQELKREVIQLKRQGYAKAEAILLLTACDYTKSTANKYWEIFCEEKKGISEFEVSQRATEKKISFKEAREELEEEKVYQK